jgi:hypothetical protein
MTTGYRNPQTEGESYMTLTKDQISDLRSYHEHAG